MKKLMLASFLFALFVTTAAQAQAPVPDPDSLSNPIKEGDPALETLPPRLDYVEDKRRISPDELPAAVRRTLESSTRYTDWQEALIFYDRNKDEYVVEFEKGEETTSHRFNAEGKPIIEAGKPIIEE